MTVDGERACGLPVTGVAFRVMQDAWFDEVGAHIQVLAELCGAMHASEATYGGTEQGETDRFGAGVLVASDDYGQLTTILRRLAELESSLNPATLVHAVTS